MNESTAFIFPGQGSQSTGMGRDIAAAFPEARRVFDEIDSALGLSISRICFEGPDEALKLTENTQPAILAVSSAIHAVIAARSPIQPFLSAGHSLGEYSAVVAARGLTPGSGANTVRQRGLFMQEAVPVGEGAMAAILGPSLEEIESICSEASEGDVIEPANINAPGQIVVAGSRRAVERAIEIAKKRGVRRALLLPVSAPFHCALMKPAEERLRPVLEAADFSSLSVPLVNNVDATIVESVSDVRAGLLRQVVSPVRWVESIQLMISRGAQSFVEIGPGAVLAGLVRRIDPSVEIASINDVSSLETWLRGANAAGEGEGK